MPAQNPTKKLSFFPLLLVVSLFFQGCCSCNDIGCFSRIFSLRFFALTQPLGAFEESELNEIVFIRTELDYTPIDSVQYGFDLTSEANTYVFEISEPDFGFDGSEAQFQDFNYLMVNPALNRIDTLSNISYSVRENRVSCENCSGLFCESDERIERSFSDFRMMFNQTIVDTTVLSYLK